MSCSPDMIVTHEGSKIEKYEPDWKMLFGALAVQVMAAYSCENDPERASEHMTKAAKIIGNVYETPLFIVS